MVLKNGEPDNTRREPDKTRLDVNQTQLEPNVLDSGGMESGRLHSVTDRTDNPGPFLPGQQSINNVASDYNSKSQVEFNNIDSSNKNNRNHASDIQGSNTMSDEKKLMEGGVLMEGGESEQSYETPIKSRGSPQISKVGDVRV